MKTLFSVIALSFAVAGLASAEPVNKECPVKGKAAKPNCKTTYQGKEVAFCCGNCLKEFKANPEKYASKLPK